MTAMSAARTAPESHNALTTQCSGLERLTSDTMITNHAASVLHASSFSSHAKA